MLLLEAV
jgi:hypothetical protein